MSSSSASESPTGTGDRGETSRGATAAHSPQDADAAAAWAFYESGLVQSGDEGGGVDDEDTEDELETADWIRFQRARTHSRLRAARQQQQQQQQQQHAPHPQQELLQSPAGTPSAARADTP